MKLCLPLQQIAVAFDSVCKYDIKDFYVIFPAKVERTAIERKAGIYLCPHYSIIEDNMNNETEKRATTDPEKTNPLVIVDNGHGKDTPGKRSPDGSVLEWRWTRDAARAIVSRLKCAGTDAVLLVPEDDDIPLCERCRRTRILGAGRRAIVVSIHINAAGDGSDWHQASGFSAFVAPRASAESFRLAGIFTSEAAFRGLAGNRSLPQEGFWRGNFAIVRDTPMPAVLTENLFMDNRTDAALLASTEGFEAIVGLHVDAVLKYFNQR